MIELTHLVGFESVQVWRLSLDVEPDEAERRSLSAAELERANRFVYARDRRRYVAAHTQLRRLLATHTGMPEGSLCLREGEFGKPYLDGAAHCQFNLSHSADVALVGIAGVGEIGVDVELLSSTPDAQSLAERHFTAGERNELAQCTPASERDLAFLRGWTRKEACLKALGSGLNLETASFEAGLDGAPRRVSIPLNGGHVQVEVRSFRHGHNVIAAVARTVSPF
jgi:4'-phosphopantetheinyl transferase